MNNQKRLSISQPHAEMVELFRKDLVMNELAISLYVKLFQHISRNGWKSSLPYIKAMRLSFVRYLAGNPVSKAEAKLLGIALKGPLPNFFGTELRNAIKDHDRKVLFQDVLSVLNVTNLSSYYPEPNFKTITDQNPSNDKIRLVSEIISREGDPLRICGRSSLTRRLRSEGLGSHLTLSIKSLHVLNKLELYNSNLTMDGRLGFKEFHLSMKNGIFGRAMTSSHLEALHPSMDKYMDHIRMIGGDTLAEHIEAVRSDIDLSDCLDMFNDSIIRENVKDRMKDRFKNAKTLRRLGIVKSPGGKTRVIAMVDYWTQCSLRPLHSFLIGNLSKWFGKTDMTMDQQSFKNRIPNLKIRGGKMFSFDLSSATDRFPIEYQKFILSNMFGKDYANAWSSLLTSEGYLYPKDNTYYKYNTGQPMGGYTSWAMFAFCHHIMVRVCGHNIHGNYDFSDYYLLGDDIVIFDEEVAREYKRIKTSLLGVEINMSKSIVSSRLFEFAKRLIFEGTEISPLTWTQLSSDNIHNVSTFISDMCERRVGGYNPSINKIRGILSRLRRKENFYSLIKAIYVSVIRTCGKRGISISISLKDQYNLGIGSCFGMIPFVDDMVRYYLIKRIVSSYLDKRDPKTNRVITKGLRSVVVDNKIYIQMNNLSMLSLDSLPVFAVQKRMDESTALICRRIASSGTIESMEIDTSILSDITLGIENQLNTSGFSFENTHNRLENTVMRASSRLSSYLSERDRHSKQYVHYEPHLGDSQEYLPFVS